MVVLPVEFMRMLGADHSHGTCTALLFKLTEYWVSGYVASYATNRRSDTFRMNLPERPPMFILLPVAYGVTFWIVVIFAKDVILMSSRLVRANPCAGYALGEEQKIRL